MSKDDALTTLGKFIDIQITEQQSSEAAGTVIAQEPEAYAAADPDQPVYLTISSEIRYRLQTVQHLQTARRRQTVQQLQIVPQLQTVRQLQIIQLPQTVQHLQTILPPQEVQPPVPAGNVHRFWIHRPVIMEERSVWN